MWSTLILKKAKASSLESCDVKSGSTFFLVQLFRAYLIYHTGQDRTGQTQDNTGQGSYHIHFPTTPTKPFEPMRAHIKHPASFIAVVFFFFFWQHSKNRKRACQWKGWTGGTFRGCFCFIIRRIYQQYKEAGIMAHPGMIQEATLSKGAKEQGNKEEYDEALPGIIKRCDAENKQEKT